MDEYIMLIIVIACVLWVFSDFIILILLMVFVLIQKYFDRAEKKN